jgi:hypothetical protein
MKDMKPYYGLIRATHTFSDIENDDDLAWLLKCIEGEVLSEQDVPAAKEDEFWEDEGSTFVRLGGSGLILRLKSMRAGKLCSFQCKFHKDLIDRITEYETKTK